MAVHETEKLMRVLSYAVHHSPELPTSGLKRVLEWAKEQGIDPNSAKSSPIPGEFHTAFLQQTIKAREKRGK
jgi:hypothetical protein